MTNSDKGNGKSGRWTIVVSAVLVGVAGWLCWDAIAHYPRHPDLWDRLYAILMSLLLVMNVAILVSDLRKRYRRVRHIELLTCEACAGRGVSTDAETNGRCWDCQGEGRIPVYHP